MGFAQNSSFGFGSSGAGGGTPVTGYVPYTGATQSVDLGAWGITSDYFQASLTPVTGYAIGRMWWNDTDGTMNLGMKRGNATLQLGMETYYPPVVNKDSIDLGEGVVVMADPAGIAQGNRISAVRAVSDGTYPSNMMLGVLTESITRNNEGYATWFGYVRDLSLSTLEPAGETWAEGDILYIDPTVPGGMTNVEPSAPNLKVSVAAITSINGGNLTILVRPTLNQNLSDSNDVQITTPAANNVLYYTGTRWQNGSVPAIFSGTTNYLAKFTATGIGNSQVFDNGTNVLVGTTTDAGYKFDVNGSARVQTYLTINSAGNTGDYPIQSYAGIGSYCALFRTTASISWWQGITATGSALGYVWNAGGTTSSLNTTATEMSWAIPLASIYNFRHSTNITLSISQNGALMGLSATNLDASALFQMNSTSRGFLRPRMTTVQRDAISTPAAGLSVYNTTTGVNNLYNGTSWLPEVTGSSTATYVAVFDGTSSIKGYSYFTVLDALYPTIAIGANGINSVGFRFKTNASSDYSYISPATGLTFYGSATYPYIDFYDKISGGTQVLRLWNSAGYVAQFAGRIGTTTTATAGTNLGAYNIDRTFAELSSGPNQHGYVDKSVFRYGAGAINSFYSEITVGTTNATYTQDHVAGFQTLLIKDGANNLATQYDYVALATLLNGGSITNRYGFYFYDANPAGGGTLTNQYGIYIPALTGAATKNIGIYSGSVVTIGTNSPSASAMLQVDSTTKGFLPPRMTGAQAEAISSPAESLLVYATDGSGVTITSKGWWGYDGATWVKLNP